MSEKKLNVFLHFRKAGGTRMVNLALANDESLCGIIMTTASLAIAQVPLST